MTLFIVNYLIELSYEKKGEIMEFNFIQAERRKAPLRMLISGTPGCGKTLTALRIAKGIEKVTGFEVMLIDSESEASLYYACNENEKEESGKRYRFKHLNLYVPTVDNFIKAITFAREKGCKNLIVDSITHEWMDLLEVVDRAAKNKYKDNSFRAWGEGTPLHRKFINLILTYPGHIICTCRAKIKHEVITLPGGGMRPKKIGIGIEQRGSTEYEFAIHFEGLNEEINSFYCAKDHTNGMFQGKVFEKPSEEIGVQIITWLMQGSGDELYIPEDPEMLEARQTIKKALKLLKPEFTKKVTEIFGKKNGYITCDDLDKLQKTVIFLRTEHRIIKNRRVS